MNIFDYWVLIICHRIFVVISTQQLVINYRFSGKCYQESVCIQSNLKSRALAKHALDAYLAIHLFDEELA